MYVQLVRGRTSDPQAVVGAFERWTQELAPSAPGWLGITCGVTDDGRVIGMLRFESEEAADSSAARPDQERWWAETEQLFDGGTATVEPSSDVEVDIQGDLDRAGFVQVMRGRSSDPARAKELMDQDPEEWAAFRPDVLGSVVVGHDDGAYTMVMYFTSEAEAREGEKREIPEKLQPVMEEMNQLSVGEPEFFDVRQPLVRSAT